MYKYQQSNKPSKCLKLQEEETYLHTNNDGITFLNMKHPADAFALNLRAYISTLTPTLKCSMDFQTTDGYGMLLRYVASYVSKFHDGVPVDALYSYHVSDVQLAYRFLTTIQPLEPEMWMSLSNMKISWSNNRTKRYSIPAPANVPDNKQYIKYVSRPSELEHTSFTEYLRAFTPDGKRYQNGNTLVGLKSYMNDEYFFQYSLMNHPHRNLQELYHPSHNDLPNCIKFFAGAYCLNSEFWKDDSAIRTFLSIEGNKSHFIDTYISYLHSLIDTFQMWQLKIVSITDLNVSEDEEDYSLDHNQNVVKSYILTCLQNRFDTYSSHNNWNDFELEDRAMAERIISDHLRVPNCDWRQPVILIGKPGAGKTRTICSIVKTCVQQGLSVLICCPTGILSINYMDKFPVKVQTNTVHSAFGIHIDPDQQSFINHEISRYDLVILDEISMISQKNFYHVYTTVNTVAVRPVFLMAGDKAQQQPISTVNGKIVATKSVLEDVRFTNMCKCFSLHVQHRCEDEDLQQFLNTIRHFIPSASLLSHIQEGKVLCPNGIVNDCDIIRAIKQQPLATFLTVSRKAANRVNKCVLESLFHSPQPIATVQMDCELDVCPLYKGMRVMITQNRNKNLGVINGKIATVNMIENTTVYLQLSNERIVPIHMVTMDNHKVLYPFCPAYALTICKSQGQTLTQAIIWFDVDTVPTATAYVAISRVKTLESLRFLTPLKPCYFRPAATTI